MADEAVLRIKVEGDGSQPTQAGASLRAPSAGTPAAAPPMGTPKPPPAAGAPPKEFDPYEAARRRRSPDQQAQVDAAYKEMYPQKKTEDAFDQLLRLATRMRGVLGGVLGSLVGAGLDAAAAFIEIRDNAKAPPGIVPTLPPMPEAAVPAPPVSVTPTVSAALQQMAKAPAGTGPITPFELAQPSAPPEPIAEAGIPLEPLPGEVFAVEPPAPLPTPPPETMALRRNRELPAIPLVDYPSLRQEALARAAAKQGVLDMDPRTIKGNAPPDLSRFNLRSAFPDMTKAPEYVAPPEAKAPLPGLNMGIAFQSDKAFGKVPETGAGFGAAAATALPLVGAIVGAVYAATRAVGDMAGAMISGAGSTLAGLVGPNSDPAHAIDSFGQGIKKAGDSVFLLAPGFSILESTVGETVSQFGRLLQAIDGSVAKYAEVNPIVAQATAMAELRQVLGDIRRGNEVGPELARYVSARADIQQKYEDVKVRILEQILPAVTGGVKLAEKLLPVVDILAKIAISTNPIIKILELIGRWLDNEEPTLTEDPTEQILRSMLNQPGPGMPGFVPGGPGIQTPQV